MFGLTISRVYHLKQSNFTEGFWTILLPSAIQHFKVFGPLIRYSQLVQEAHHHTQDRSLYSWER